MKKVIMIALATLVMATFYGCGIRFGIESRSNNRKGEINIDKSVSVDGIENIDISLGAIKANISSYNGEELKIVGSLGDYAEDIKIEELGSTITVTDKISYTSMFGINFNEKNYTLDIMIPEKYVANFRYSYGAGSTNITGINVNNFTIEGGAGELVIDDITFKKMDLNAGVGSSRIYLKEKCGDINVEGGVGEVYIDMREIGGNLKYDGGIGSAKIRIPIDAPIKFNTSTGLGQSNVRAKTSNEGTYTFDLNVGIGEISVDN